MTSNAAPAPGAAAGRRRALGRGPGGPENAPRTPGTDPPGTPGSAPQTPSFRTPGTEPPGTPGSAPQTPAPTAPTTPLPPEPSAPGEPVEPAVCDDPAVPHGSAGPHEPPAPGDPAEHGPTEPRESAEPRAPAVPHQPSDGVFTVRLANFEGPFDLLLQLISRHRLDVTEVALSRVTDEFMAHIRAMGPDWDLDRTTEFLVVAATLLDLKAARLLPAAEVEDEGDLALLEARDLLFARLLQYRAYKQIAGILDRRLDEEARSYPRTVGLEPQHAELLPEVVIGIGPEGLARLAVKAMQPRPRPQVYVDHIHAPLVSVQEQAGIVVARLRELGEADFRTLVEDTGDTLTVVARFLALLELYREKAVALDQETALGRLLVRWTGDADAAPLVTDEFDRPPERPEEKKA
ncbi:segregation/condensation protein A [Streptomyces sp. NPDC006184]|uniref:segregation and condensation protein A n=1 Tax=Streptomyces sp. NPDC006184 TaxID=3155455 RepID=UPI0033A7EBCF